MSSEYSRVDKKEILDAIIASLSGIESAENEQSITLQKVLPIKMRKMAAYMAVVNASTNPAPIPLPLVLRKRALYEAQLKR